MLAAGFAPGVVAANHLIAAFGRRGDERAAFAARAASVRRDFERDVGPRGRALIELIEQATRGRETSDP